MIGGNPMTLPSYSQVKQAAQQVGAAFKPVPVRAVTPEGEVLAEPTPPQREGRGPNIPYRGTNVHGGPDQVGEVTDNVYGNYVDVEYEAEPEPDHVVTVRIASNDSEITTNFRSGQTFAGVAPQMLFNRMRNRTELKIKNIGTDRVWIGHDESLNAMNGYPLDANAEITISSTEDIWALCSTGNGCTLAFIMTYTQEA